MKKQISFILSAILCLSLFISTVPACAAESNGNITVTLNGKTLSFDVPPQIVDNRTMVPMRTIFEAMGAKVDWDQSAETITAIKDNKKVVLQIQKTDMKVNNQTISLDAAPQIINGRTFVPIRAVAESFDTKVMWSSEKQLVSITTDDQIPMDTTNSASILESMPSNANIENSSDAPYVFVVGADRYLLATDNKWAITVPFKYYDVVIQNGGRVFKNDDISDEIFIKISKLSDAKVTLENLAKTALDDDINAFPNGVTCAMEKDVTKETIDNLDFYTYTIASNSNGMSESTYHYTYFTVYDGLLFEFSSSTPSQTVLDEFRYILTSFADSTEES